MLAAWQAVFAPVPKTMPDDADESAAKAAPETPLAQAGLSARALSALEPFGVRTVADLVAVDPVRLNRMSGVADVTRREVKSRATQWRRQFAASVTGRGAPGQARPTTGALPDPIAAAELLAERAGTQRAQSRRKTARLLLGLEPQSDPFATQAELSAVLQVSAARTAQQVGALQEAWAADDQCRTLLDALAGASVQALADFDGVATVGELSGAILAALPPAPAPDDQEVARIAAGLLRVALDRNQALGRADDETAPLSSRRRGGKIILLATDPALLDPAEAIGRMADHLVASADAAGEPLIPAQRAIPRLQATWARAADSRDTDQPIPGPERLLRLAAALAEQAALSGRRELHRLDLPAATALGIALTGAASIQRLTPQEIRDRFRARFPALPPLPERPRLDELIRDAGLDLLYDEQDRAYRQPSRAGDTTRLSSRPATILVEGEPELISGGPVAHRLAESAASRSFLALGIDWSRLDKAVDVLTSEYGAIELDVTQLLIDAMRQQAAAAGLPWETVRAADAAPPGSRDAAGLAVLVQRSLPAVDAAIDQASAGAPAGVPAAPAHRDRPAGPLRPPRPARARAPTWPPAALRPSGWPSRSCPATRARSSTAARSRSPPPVSSSASNPTGLTAGSASRPEAPHDRDRRADDRPAASGPDPGGRPARAAGRRSGPGGGGGSRSTSGPPTRIERPPPGSPGATTGSPRPPWPGS